MDQKRKISQTDLRALMQEKKRKLTEAKRKIDSPLAKYLDDKTLLCIICNSTVKSESMWYTHINSKNHRDSIARKKQSKEKLSSQTAVVNINIKKEPNPELKSPKKLKGILKNKIDDSVLQSVNTMSNDSVLDKDTSCHMDTDAEPQRKITNELPEGFFDDPVMDAKVRNVDYKDPVEEEWERFQKEIQEENISSELILDEDQEAALRDKEIEWVDEQMQMWSWMQTLEEKVEIMKKGTLERKNISLPIQDSNDDSDSSVSIDEEFNEYIDWRSKKSFK